MRASVLAGFPSFTAQFEGVVPYMYTDALGLVTTGVGNLIDPMPAALALPWKNPDGSDATADRIAQVWTAVKQAWPGLQSVNSDQVPGNDLRLTTEDIEGLVRSKLHGNETLLRGYFRAWDDLPADAQMGVLSMGWAMGPGFPSMFPAFTRAVNALDFDTAAAQSKMRESPGIAPRNAANRKLFQNAAIVQKSGGNPETLWYPGDAVPGQGGGFIAGGGFVGAVVGALVVLGASAAGWWYFHGGKV